MPRQKPHLLSLHVILRKHSVDQMLFAFMRGVRVSNPSIPVREAARMFEEAFSIQDFEPEHAVQMYYDLLHEYMRQSKIFEHEKHHHRATPRRSGDQILANKLESAGAK